ncbi:MAG: hypothetical protein Q9226_007947, partial [Calogaya cf. arnoldii]
NILNRAMGKHNNPTMPPITAFLEIQRNPDLWYRIQILLHDLGNVGNDVLSEKRLSATTNELYISGPYFTEAEATQILFTIVGPNEESITPSPITLLATIQDTIHQGLANFFDKRKASGDARPCGPHDMLPIYLDVFKLKKGHLKDEKFLGRLRRSGLGDFMSKTTTKDDALLQPVESGAKAAGVAPGSVPLFDLAACNSGGSLLPVKTSFARKHTSEACVFVEDALQLPESGETSSEMMMVKNGTTR